MQLDKLANNDGHDLSQLVLTHSKLALAIRIASHVFHDTLHERVVADSLLQEIIEVVHVVHLIEDPSLLELKDDSSEETCGHLNKICLL